MKKEFRPRRTEALESICNISRSSDRWFSSEFHCHDSWEIFAYLDGSLIYYVEDRVYRPVLGDILVIPPGKMHQAVLTENRRSYERFVLHLQDSYLQTQMERDPQLREIFHEFRRQNQYLVNFSGDDAVFVHGLLRRLESRSLSAPSRLSALCSLIYAVSDAFAQNPNERGTHEDDLVSGVIQYINSRYTEPLNLDDLCAQFYVSKSYLNRRFKEYTQLTLYDYILTKRIGLARRLLRAGHNAGETADQCGFQDYSTFYRTFTAKTGCSPKEFRNRLEPEGQV